MKRTPEQIERMRQAQIDRQARQKRANEVEAMKEAAGAAEFDRAVGHDVNHFVPTIADDVFDALEALMWAVALNRADRYRHPGGCIKCNDGSGRTPCPCQDAWALLKRIGRVTEKSRR